jgi:hypothetical protein
MVSAFLGPFRMASQHFEQSRRPAWSVNAVRRWNKQLVALLQLLWFALLFYRKPGDDQIECEVLPVRAHGKL